MPLLPSESLRKQMAQREDPVWVVVYEGSVVAGFWSRGQAYRMADALELCHGDCVSRTAVLWAQS